MPVRKSKAVWEGDLKSGTGVVESGSGALKSNYSFSSRFESGLGTNPEELIAAAHSGCFSMQLSGLLGKEGFQPKVVRTEAKVQIVKMGEGFEINHIELETEADVPDIESNKFNEIAEKAKATCPVSMALKNVSIDLKAKLLTPESV